MNRVHQEMKAMNRIVYCALGLGLALAASGCEEAEKLAGECGLACPGQKGPDGVEIKGVLEGNAAISGVAQVDAFFAAVNKFRGAADGVSAGIEAELDKIRGDFGLAADADVVAGVRGKITTNLEGGLEIYYQPARCAVDAQATVEAAARCEAEVVPPMVSVECKGSCELEAGAELECEADAQLECTFTGPTVMCEGECSGTCEVELDAAVECSGICRGECSGECSAYSDAAGTQCAGTCEGMCEGTCEAEVAANGTCMGTCRGECTVTGTEAECMGSARAACRAEANASIMCEGKCEGEFEPPSASAECKATARAEAKINVQCTPPRIEARYQLKADLDAMAAAKFEAALETLIRVRLPALTAITARANSVASAGADLVDAAQVAVKASIETAQADAGIRAKAGLICALGQVDEVEMALSESGDRLNESLMASASLTAMLGMD